MSIKHPASPCIGVCQYPNDVCKGCHRTMDEVLNWYDYTAEQKQAVIDRLDHDYPNRTRR